MLNGLVSYKKEKNSVQVAVSHYSVQNLYAHNVQHFIYIYRENSPKCRVHLKESEKELKYTRRAFVAGSNSEK